ncbi:hypothetical protein Tco_0966130 [Tanacetum coccineum]
MSIRELQEQVDALAQAVKQYCSNRSCSCCGGPHNGGNCPNFFNKPRNIGWRHTRVSIVEESLTRALIVRHETHLCLIMVPVTIKTLVFTNLHSILRVSHSSSTVVSFVEVHIIVMIAKQGTCLSLIRVPITIKTLVFTNLHSILRVSHSSSTIVSYVEVHIIVMIAKQGTCSSMIRVLVTIKTLVMTNLHFIICISNNNTTMRSVEILIIALIVKPGTNLSMSLILDLVFDSLIHSARENNHILEEILRTQMPDSPIVLKEPKGSDDYTEVTYDNEQCLSDHYTAPVTPPAYTPSIPFFATMEPANTLLMGDEVISTIPAKEIDEFIKSSVDDLVPIPRESEMTSDSISECDMSTPLPPTDVGEVDFDINSPLGEQVVDFFMKNVDVADLPRHMVKQLFGLSLKNPSLTKGMSDEPLGDDTKSIPFDVTFSNPLFDFNDDFTLCKDNPLFDEEFEDISSLDPPKLTPVIDEPTLLVTLPLPCTNVLGDAIVDIDLFLGEQLDTLSTGDREIDFNPSRDIEELERLLADDYLDNSISIGIDDRYYDSEGDIIYFEQLLNEYTSSDVSPTLLPTESSSLDLSLPDPERICLKEVERFNPFFSLTQSGGKTRVMETLSLGFHHMPSPCPAAYSPKEVMYCYFHPHLTSGDGFDHGPQMK